MTHKITKEKNSKVEIEVTLSGAEFMAYWDKGFKRLQQEIEIEGFRKGHATEAAIVAKYGESAILQEMANVAIDETYPKIVIEEKVKIISEPHIHVVNMSKEEGFTYHAHVNVYPEISLPDYKALSSECAKERKTVEDTTDEELKQIMDNLDEQVKATIPDIENVIKENLKLEKETAEKSRIRSMILEKIVKAADELNTENWPENFEERDKAQVLVLEISKKEDLKATPEEIEAEVMKIVMHLNSSNPNEKVDEVRVKAYAEQIIVNEKVLAMLEK